MKKLNLENANSMSALEVAKILHVSKNTIYELIKRKELSFFNVGRKIRFTEEDVNSYIQRQRHEKQIKPTKSILISSPYKDQIENDKTFIISGQDVILDILSNQIREKKINCLRAFMSGFDGLLSMYHNNIDVAAVHLYDGQTKKYNSPYVRRLLPATHCVMVNISYRLQGFYVKKSNPKNIQCWEDLCKKGVSFVNRKKGSASRILLDEKLLEHKISPSLINGYDNEVGSHLSLASLISKNIVDVGIGTERITKTTNELDFIPLQKERFDIVIKKDALDSYEVKTMLKILNSPSFKEEIENISGNDYSDLGKIIEEI